MDKSSKIFLKKRDSLLSLLKYIDEQKIWNTAKYLVQYIEKAGNIDLDFLILISNLIEEAINNAQNNISKNKTNKIFNILEKIKKEEKECNIKDNEDVISLLDELNHY